MLVIGNTLSEPGLLLSDVALSLKYETSVLLLILAPRSTITTPLYALVSQLL